MHILFVVHQFMPEFAAGTERVTLNLAKSAQRDGHQVEILTRSVQETAPWSDDTGELRFTSVEGIPVYGLRGFALSPSEELGFKPKQRSGEVERFLNSRDFDLVHVTHPMRMLDVVDTIRARHIPYLITLTDFYLPCWRTNLIRSNGALCSGPEGGLACIRHCSTLEMNDRVLMERHEQMRVILEEATVITVCSEYVARVFRNEYPHLSIQIIPHGVDLLRFRPVPRERNGDEVVLGCVGTLSKMKGVHVLAEAFAKAAPANWQLKFTGPVHDHDFTEQLHELARQHPGISIQHAIPAETIPSTLASLDLLCLPTMVPETFSLAVHEGFAAGVPCLVSHLGYPAEIVRKTGCGSIATAADVDAWATLIKHISQHIQIIDRWRKCLPLPTRLEEEGFLYSQLYRRVTGQITAVPARPSDLQFQRPSSFTRG